MAQAAGRIARIGTAQEEEDDGQLVTHKAKGKKSGALLMASDTVEQQIDWPQMHVKRVVGGKRENVAYTDLSVEEFVYGYIAMILTPRNNLDMLTMVKLLSILMQDAMDYSWNNARGFYDSIGWAVENGEMKWTDTDAIRDMQMMYSRTVFPDKKEQKPEGKTPLRQAPVGMKCCLAFQKRTCENTKDHPPFTHACTNCFKVCNALCRRAEDECMRKASDESKNGKKRES